MNDSIIYQPETNELHLTLSARLSQTEIAGWRFAAHVSRTPFGLSAMVSAEVTLVGRAEPVRVQTFQDAAATTGLLAEVDHLPQALVRTRAHRRDLEAVPAQAFYLEHHGDLPYLVLGPDTLEVQTTWPAAEMLGPDGVDLRDLSPVHDAKTEGTLGYYFPPSLADDPLGQVLYFTLCGELHQAALGPEGLGWARVQELLVQALACRDFTAARAVVGAAGDHESVLSALVAWWLLRSRNSPTTLALPVPGDPEMAPIWNPDPDLALALVYQLTNLWLFFGEEEWGALGRTALAASAWLPLELGTCHVVAALGPGFCLPREEWAFAQLFLEGVHNQVYPVPDELTLQVSQGPFQEVRLWHDGHGRLLGALGVKLPNGRTGYAWVGLSAVEDRVEARVSFCRFAEDVVDPEATTAAAVAATLVAGAFRDAVVLEMVARDPEAAPANPNVRLDLPRPGRCTIRYLARRVSMPGGGWGPRVARSTLQDAGALKKGVTISGYFVTYHKGQQPDPERMLRLADAGIAIPEGRSDYRSGHTRLIYSAREVEYRSRSALSAIVGFQAQVLAGGVISDWRVAQEAVADKLKRLGLTVQNRFYRDRGIDVLATGAGRLAVQVKAVAKGVGPGAVRDFATAVGALREHSGDCTALLVATVGRPTAEALAWARRQGIACLHITELDAWLATYVGAQ